MHKFQPLILSSFFLICLLCKMQYFAVQCYVQGQDSHSLQTLSWLIPCRNLQTSTACKNMKTCKCGTAGGSADSPGQELLYYSSLPRCSKFIKQTSSSPLCNVHRLAPAFGSFGSYRDYFNLCNFFIRHLSEYFFLTLV